LCQCADGGFVLTHLGAEPERQRIFRLGPSREFSKEAVRSAAFSPDGRYLACGNPEGIISLLRLSEKGTVPEIRAVVPTARDLAERPNAADGLNQSDISKDALAYVGGGDPENVPPELVAVLGDVRFRVSERPGPMAFTPDGKQLAVADGGSEIRFLDAQTGRFLRLVKATEVIYDRMTFSPGGKRLCGRTNRGDFVVIDTQTGRLVWKGKAIGESGMSQFAFSADGKTLLLSTTAGRFEKPPAALEKWDAETGTRTKYVWPGEGRRDFAISPDGTKAVELVGGQILLRDLAAFTEPQRVGSGG